MQTPALLELGAFLKTKGWTEEQIQLALIHIISRATYPASKVCTSEWIKQNSAVGELSGYHVEKINQRQTG